MATPHPALDAAFNQFAQQPGVTPATGTGTGTGTAAGGDLHAVLRVQSMVVEFGGKTYSYGVHASQPVTPDMLSNLQGTLNGSPVLAEEIKRAATTADPLQPSHRILESFAFTKPGDGVGGSFNAPDHTMNLVPESLATAPPGSGQRGYDPYDLTFVVGHEVQHGFDAQSAAHDRATFFADVQTMATTPGPVHDYTALVERHIQSGREDEAKAEIAGWNALRSRVQHDHGSATLANINVAAPGRAADFTEFRNGAFVPHANVQLNPDLSMSQTPGNVAAMGHNYFDRPTAAHQQPGDTRNPMALAHGGVEDYPNYYAGWAVAVIGSEERTAVHPHGVTPQVQINMAHAGLYEDMMEKAGLDLGKSKQSVPYLDSSSQPATAHAFDHTSDGPHQFKYQPVAPSRLDDPGHADHAMFRQVRGHVATLDQSLGRTPDQYTDQISSALVVQARADGLHRIDQIALSDDGSRLWAVQTPPGRTDHLFDRQTSVPTAESMTPMEHSAAKWPEAMQQFQQTQQQQQTQSQPLPQQDQAQAQGPVMTHGGR
jgi:hypothetical protein